MLRPLHTLPDLEGMCRSGELYICHGPLEVRRFYLSCALPVHLHISIRIPWVTSLSLHVGIGIEQQNRRSTVASMHQLCHGSRCRTREMSFEIVNNEQRSQASSNDVHGCKVSCNWSRSYIPTSTVIEHQRGSQVEDE